MDVDNDINELIETRQLRSGTPLRRSGVDTPTRRRSMRTRTQASADKSEQSSSVTRITQTQTTEVRYSQTGKASNDSDASGDHSDTDRKKEKSSRKSYSRRTVVNGASVSEEDNDVVTVKEVEPQSVVTSTETLIQDAGYSSDEGGKPDLSAYKIYKSVEDYWDVFPKTDYTYARSSTDRKEISPGVINPPNMSRRSLHPHTIPSVSDLRKKSPTKLHIMKREVVKHDAATRYFTETKSDGYVSEKLKRWSTIDSDVDEVDEKFSSHKASTSTSTSTKKSVIVTKLITVWTYITTVLLSARQRVSRIFRREKYEEVAHFSSVQLESEEQSSAWLRFQGLLVYWATSFQTRVVAWLLYWLHGGQDNVSSERRQRKKYLQMFLLGLLPLLILLGLHIVRDSTVTYQEIKSAVLDFCYQIPVFLSIFPTTLYSLLNYIGKIPPFLYQIWLNLLDMIYQLPNPFYIIGDILSKAFNFFLEIPEFLSKTPSIVASIPEKLVDFKDFILSLF